jgi:hypothetical protein
MKIHCPSCSQRYDVPEEDAGSTVTCQICQTSFQISSEIKNEAISGSNDIARPNRPANSKISSSRSSMTQSPEALKQTELLFKYMPLEPGELVTQHLEGNAYNLSPNIFARITGAIESIFHLLLGCSKKAHVIVTNRRVILIETQQLFWVLLGSASAKSIMPRSIGSTGYKFARSLVFFESNYLEFSHGSFGFLVKSKNGRDPVYEVIKSIVTLSEKVSTK